MICKLGTMLLAGNRNYSQRKNPTIIMDSTDNPEQSADYKNNRTVRWLKKNISRNILSSNLISR